MQDDIRTTHLKAGYAVNRSSTYTAKADGSPTTLEGSA